jgi:hypothetical protein
VSCQWRTILALHSCQDVKSLLVNLDVVLISELTHILLHLVVKTTELLIERLLLAKSALEHLDLIAQLIVFELILVGFPPDLLITLLPQLLELALLPLLQSHDQLFGLVQLHTQIPNQHLLVLFESIRVYFQSLV